MKNKFLSNILLTFVWVALTGDFSFENYLFGFFLYELVKANLEVAYEVITPRLNVTPGIIMVPLDVKSDIGITVLANMISLTPGTLSIDVSNDKKVLFVHAMYLKDREKFIRGIKDGFERRILEVLS